MGAVKVDKALGFSDSMKNHSAPTHFLLEKLVTLKCLEQCKKGKGFKYKNSVNFNQPTIKKGNSFMEISYKDKKRKILDYLKNKSEQCFGALRIDNALGFDPGGTATGEHKSWNTHNILHELSKEGFVKQCPDKKGFCFISNERDGAHV